MLKFVADPGTIRTKGIEIDKQAEQFSKNVESIYNTVEQMVNSDFLSPDARAIAEEIKGYKGDLIAMTRAIREYATFCSNTSNKIIRNQENNIDSIK